MDDNNILNETTDGKTFDWNSFLEASEAETNSSDYNWNIDFDEWPDEWNDFEIDETEIEQEETNSNHTENNTNEEIYYLEGYGQIYQLDEFLNNGNRVIELLQHAKSKEQFNYILGMSKKESHDANLLNYLESINYSIEDFVSINFGYQIFQFKGLVEYLLSKANEDQTKDILYKIAYVDEKIANIVATRDDMYDLIKSNYHLKDKIVSKKIIQYFKENPEKVNFKIINECYLDTDIIREFINLGYQISENSPYNILQNNEIMKEEFLKTINIEGTDTFNKLDEEIKSIPGAYGMLYKSRTKEIIKKEFTETFGGNSVEQMIKYIVLGDYQIDLSKINSTNIKQIKNVYDSLNNNNNSTFDISLFIKIIYKFNMNPSIIDNYNKDKIDLNKLKTYIEYKELVISDINELNNIDKILYNFEQSKIENTNNIIDLKNIIFNILTNQTYFETKKGLLEITNAEKLSVLKNSLKDETKKKELDSYIILSDFINKIDNIDDLEQLKKIASVINIQILNNGINFKWLDFNRKVMNYYVTEVNERMTNFNDYITDSFYDASDFSFSDGTNVNGRRVKVAHIKSGEEFNSLIHVLNAYQNGGTTGTIESTLSPKFIGQSYISLTGISDEYNRICVNRDSRESIKVLYSNIPSGDLFCAANRDTGIQAKSNSKNIDTRLPSNMAPFRRIVRNTEIHGSETYNEFDIFRDNLVPSGIAFMDVNPTEEEINAAAYLGVPLVKIDDLQESYRKDSLSIGKLSDDQSFYNIKDHEYENKEVFVTPNDKYDTLLNIIQEKIQTKAKAPATISSFIEEDELGFVDYFVMYNGEKYSTTPVYNFADSKRKNIKKEFYERSLIKNKIYSYLNIQPNTIFITCKYPSGKELLSVLENTNEKRVIDRYIDYLVDIPDMQRNFNELESFNINSIEEFQLLNKIISIDNKSYIKLFESFIKTNNYIEPSILISEIVSKKEQLNLVLTKYNEFLNQTQVSINNEASNIFENLLVSDNGNIEEEHKSL